ncbi:LytTr DNA-binding domain-containing protein [Saccharicrinis carchari]|uniref:LytTr DNA-binding domain-containing protein n=1 Tax=Saccharicrinis carchari TaxID=1168039 RepID=A0A521E991_SACCC|nr:LytTR family DNA-binding domain-containing protein [Saccharicrinis carchari]SMO80332.1 LytTr DNA-binding domain-containing protein [Saccharicrinis carchari]
MKKSTGKLVLSTRDHYHLIEIENIVYCQSENTYTTFYLNDGQKIKVSVPIKTVENQLPTKSFVRPHQSYLVNVQHIKSIHKCAGGNLLMDNGQTISISSRKKSQLLHFLQNIARIQV